MKGTLAFVVLRNSGDFFFFRTFFIDQLTLRVLRMIETCTDTTDIRNKPSKITGDKKTLHISLKKDSFLGLKVMLNGVHQAVYVDNFSLKPKQ